MLYLADLGLVNALGIAWFDAIGPDGEKLEHEKNLARYIIARYGALPMVWTLCGEVAGYVPGPQREKYLRYWREVALFMESLAGYETLQTAHSWSELPYSAYYESEDWFDFTLNQAGHGNLPINSENYSDWFNAHPDKPFIEGESMYELCSTLESIGPRSCSDDLVRRAAYTAIQCGCCGYTYGAQGIWDSVWDITDIRPWAPIFNRFGATWGEAIDAPGGEQMGIMKTFYEEHEFHRLIPDRGSNNDANIFRSKIKHLILALPDRSRIIVYFPNSPVGTCSLSGMNDAEYHARWFDPRSGEYSEPFSVKPSDGQWETPAPPSFHDWLLVIETQ